MVFYSCLATLGVIATGVLLYYGRKYFEGGKCTLKTRLDSKVVLITGSNSGIGRITAIELAKLGATVVIACRDQRKGKEVEAEIGHIVGRKPLTFALDLTDLRSVEKFVEELKASSIEKIDILINNAGVMGPQTRELTKQGFELQFGVNHLAHFYLTELLIPLLQKAKNPRVINVSSVAYKYAHLDFQNLNFDSDANTARWMMSTWVAYSNSKLCNILHAQELSRKYQSFGLKAVSLHPGVVNTDLLREVNKSKMKYLVAIGKATFLKYFEKTPFQGAQTTLYCALLDYDKLTAGAYYSDCAEKVPVNATHDKAINLWEVSEQLIRQ